MGYQNMVYTYYKTVLSLKGKLSFDNILQHGWMDEPWVHLKWKSASKDQILLFHLYKPEHANL